MDELTNSLLKWNAARPANAHTAKNEAANKQFVERNPQFAMQKDLGLLENEFSGQSGNGFSLTPQKPRNAIGITENAMYVRNERQAQLNELDAQKQLLDDIYAKNRAKWSAETSTYTITGGRGAMMERAMLKAHYAKPQEQREWEAAYRNNEIARKNLQNYTEADYTADKKRGREKPWYERLTSGVETTYLPDLMPGSLSEPMRSNSELEVLRKAKNKEPLSEVDKLTLNSILSTRNADSYIDKQGGLTGWGKTGQIGLHSATFLTELYGTGGSLGITPITKAVAKQGFKAASTAVGKLALDAAIREAIRTPMMSSFVNNFNKSTINQYSINSDQDGDIDVELSNPQAFISRLWQSYAGAFTENYSEQFGNLIGGGWIGRSFRKAAPKVLGARTASMLNRITAPQARGLAGDFVGGLQKYLNWNGTVNEYLEEKFGELLRPVLTGDTETWRNFFSGKDNLVTFGSVALLGGVANVAQTPLMIADEARTGTIKNRAIQNLKDIKDVDLRQSMLSAMSASDTEQRAQRMAVIDWSKADIDDMTHALDYFNFKTQRDYLRGAQENIASEDKAAKAVQNLSRFYAQNSNKDSGALQKVADNAGNEYYLLSGDANQSSVDSILYVRNAATGVVEQLPAADLTLAEQGDLNSLLSQFTTQIASSSQLASFESDIADIEAQAAAAGIDPQTAIDAYSEADAKTEWEYSQGDTVTLADGRNAQFIGYLDDMTTASVIITDPETAQESSIEIPKSQIVSKVQSIGEPITEHIAEPAEPISKIPLQKDGQPDYDAMPASMFFEEYSKITSPQEAIVELDNELKNVQKQITKLKSGTSQSRNAKVANLTKIAALQAKADEINTVVNQSRQAAPKAAAKIEQKTLKEQMADLGDYVSIEDYILRDIASGQRFAWANKAGTKGLAAELGFVGKVGELRSRLSMLSNDGPTPEQYAESLHGNFTAGEVPGLDEADSGEIRDIVLEILQATPRRSVAAAKVLELHGADDYDFSEDLLEYERNADAAEQAMYDSALDDMLASMTPEDITEIDTLFAEDYLPLHSQNINYNGHNQNDARTDSGPEEGAISNSQDDIARTGDNDRASNRGYEKTDRGPQQPSQAAQVEPELRFSEVDSSYDELRDIKAKAIKRGDFLKAPNGEPTNLTEHQWLQVRSAAFKKWFGDWEKAARIEKLHNSVSAKIAADQYSGKYELNYKSAQAYIFTNLTGAYIVDDTAEVIELSRVGARKVASHNTTDTVHLQSIVAIPQLIKNAIFITEQINEKGNSKYDSYRHYVSGLSIDDVDYTVRITVGVKNGKRYYDHGLTEIEKGTLIDSLKRTRKTVAENKSSNIEEQAPLSDYKDRRLMSILQNDSSKVVDANGEPSVVYHGTGDNFTEFKQSEIRDVEGSFFFAQNQEEAQGYVGDGNTMSVFVNLRNPADFENLPNNELYHLDSKRAIVQSLIALGYDGWMSEMESGWGEVSAFYPHQIKSATHNTGEFDGQNADIRFSESSTKVERIEKLRNSQPVRITPEMYEGKYELNRDAAQQWLLNNIRGRYTIKDTNETIIVSRSGVKKVTSHSMGNEAHLKSIAAIPQIIENAIFIEEIPLQKSNAHYDSYRYYVCGLNIDDLDYTVKVIIGVKDGAQYYDHALTEIEKGRLIESISQVGFKPKGGEPNPSYTESKDKRLISILQTNLGQNENVQLYNNNGIEKLRNSQPVRITGNEITPSEDIKQYRKNAFEYGKNLRGEYVNKDTGLAITLNRDAVKEILQHDYKDIEHIQSIAAIAKIIENATYIATTKNEDIAKHPDVSSYDYYVCGLRIGAVDYTIRAVVATRADGKRYYDHKLSTIEKGKLIEKFTPYSAFVSSGLSSTVGLEELSPLRPAIKSKQASKISPAYGVKDKRLLSILQVNDIKIEKLQKLAAKFSVAIEIVNSNKNLPDDIKTKIGSTQFKGLYDKSSGKIYFNTANIDNQNDAQATFLHEVVAHKGIDGLLGKANADRFYTAVFNSIPKAEQNRLLAKYKTKIVAGDEFVARIAQGDITPGLMHRVMASIRNFFRETLGLELTISNNDIAYMLLLSKRNLAKPNKEAGSAGSSEIRLREDAKPAYRASGEKGTFKSNAIQVQQALQDNTIKVHLVQKEVKARGGVITPLTNVYEALNHADGKANAAMDKFSRNYINPFIDIVKEFQKKTKLKYDEITTYMLAKHSLERHLSGISALSTNEADNWTQAHVEQIIAEFESKFSKADLDRFWNTWRAATQQILDTAVRSGRMSLQDKQDILASGWQYYVPLRGKDFKAENEQNLADVFYTSATVTASKNRNGKNVVNIKAEGRTSKAFDPIATLANMADTEIYLGSINEAKRTLLRLVEQNPQMSDIWQMKDRWYVRSGDSWAESETMPDVKQILASNIARRELRTEKDEAKREQLQQQITVTRKSREAKSYTGIDPAAGDVVVLKDGVKHVINLKDPEVAAAINGQTDSSQQWLTKYPGAATRVMAQLATSKNPAFIIPNFTRDLASAMMYNFVDSNGNMFGFLSHALSSWTILDRHFRGKARPLTVAEIGTYDIAFAKDWATLRDIYGKDRVNDTLYDLFAANGGQTGYVHIPTPDQYQRKIEKRIKTRTGKNVLHKGFKGLNNGVDYTANLSENAVRYATFISQLEAGSTVFDAVSYAKNITVNFNRKGKYGKGIGSLFMFFNASVQALQNKYSLWGNKDGKSKKEMAAQRARFIVAQAVMTTVGYFSSMMVREMLLSLVGDDEIEYQISDYVRRTNLIIPAPFTEAGYIKIPIPVSERPFYALGVMVCDLVNGEIEADELASNFTQILADSFSPVPVDYSIDKDNGWSYAKPLVPSAIRPLAEIGYNENFTGRPINRSATYSPNTPDSELGLKNANETLVTLTKWLNKVGGGNVVTPAGSHADGSVDIRNWLDVSPSTLEHLLVGYTGGIGRIINETRKLLSTPAEVRNIPIVNRFVGQAYQKDPSGDYYDIKRNIETVYNNNRNTEKLGIPSALFSTDEFQAKKREFENKRQALRRTEKAMSGIKAEMKQTQFNTDRYNELEAEIDAMQREFIKQYNDKRN